MTDKDYIFPKLKITLGQVKACEGMTKKEAYTKLGVGRRCFYTRIKALGLGYLFHSPENKIYFMPRYLITLDEAKECAGLSIYEAAEKLKVSFSSFEREAKTHNIIHLFIGGAPKQSREDRELSRGIGPKLIQEKVDCLNPACTTKVNIEYFSGDKPDRRRFCSNCKRGSNWFEENAQLSCSR